MRYLAPIVLAFVMAPAFAQRVGEGEPNDNASEARGIHVGEKVDGEIEAAVAGVPDEDWFSFRLDSAVDLLAWTGPGFANAIGDTRLALRNSDGSLILEVDDGNTSTHGFYSVMTLGNVAPGDYLLVVTGYAASVGTYTLDLISAELGTYVRDGLLRPVFEGPENNDPRQIGGSASVSLLATRNYGAVSVGGGGISWRMGPEDYDFYSFHVSTEGIITLATGPGSGVAVGDTVLHLTDGAGTPLAFDDDSGPGAYSRLSFDALPGTYHAVVRGFAPANVGSYELDIRGPPPPLQGVAANFVRQQHSCAGGGVELGTRSVAGWPLARPGLPLLGSTFSMDLTGMPADATVFALLDSSVVPGGVLLSSYGQAPSWCRSDLAAGPSSRLLLGDVNGNALWDLQIPSSGEFLGMIVEAQAVVIDSAGNHQLVMSRRGTLLLGHRH